MINIPSSRIFTGKSKADTCFSFAKFQGLDQGYLGKNGFTFTLDFSDISSK